MSDDDIVMPCSVSTFFGILFSCQMENRITVKTSIKICMHCLMQLLCF